MAEYIAHTCEDGRQQLLKEHLEETAELCKNFANVFMAGEYGYAAGLLHDLGKYSIAFQNRILNNGPKVDHSTAGACVAYELYHNAVLPSCIAGHHSGLLDIGNRFSNKDEASLLGRLKKGPELLKEKDLDYSNYKEEIKPPSVIDPQITNLDKGDGYYSVFFLRMLYSCLVDADYLNTEKFVSHGEKNRNGFDDITALYDKFEKYKTKKKLGENLGKINEKRSIILNECLSAAENTPGVFSLTVPTGGGKTISSLGFALKHAKKYGKKRIIYVIPYTSIIEQNAGAFRQILGDKNIVEHHMNVDYEDDEDGNNKYKLATENWDAPVIVTTNVQFFESLHANRSSRCRKLHNIANSIIVFDEAQMLPNDYLRPCVRAIEELVTNYKTTALLCTATQPSLNKFFHKQNEPKEIISDVDGLYNFFRRVEYENIGDVDIAQLNTLLNKEKQVLCITNSKKEAKEIFAGFTGTNKFHLTTSMYPAHRREILIKIRQLLKDNEPCQVVATSLIEAGVDVDFPAVYREMAGIDNIIQAGGRCNREGRRARAESKVYIYSINEIEYKLPRFIKQPMEATKLTMDENTDIASLKAIKKYFDSLHFMKGKDALDSYSMLERMGKCSNVQFKAIAADFKLIKARTIPVFVPIPENKEIENQIRNGVRNRTLLRKMSKYTVAVYEQQFKKLLETSKVEMLDGYIAILTDGNSYDKDTGLSVIMEDGIGMFI